MIVMGLTLFYIIDISQAYFNLKHVSSPNYRQSL